MPGILLVDNYDSFTFNLFAMIQAQTDEPVTVVRNDQWTLADVQAMQPSRIVLSPGPGHPANPTDFGVCADILEHAAALGCPVLGVCLGHQGMAHAFGGRVTQAPAIVHGKTSPVRWLTENPLSQGLSNPFEAMRYHSLVVADDGFPETLEVLARDEVHGLMMALRHRTLPLYGVQFHPESIGTPEGRQLLANFLAIP